jgi:cation diffusion facilitator family transporter
VFASARLDGVMSGLVATPAVESWTINLVGQDGQEAQSIWRDAHEPEPGRNPVTSIDESSAADPPSAGYEELHRRALRLEWLTTSWNVIEAVIAIAAGVVSRSIALVAFGADSLIEVLSSVGVLWRLLTAGPEASAEEHERAEGRALIVVGVTFFLLAAYIVVDAGVALAKAEAPENSSLGLVLSVASLMAMPALGIAKQRTARMMGSKALEADAVETWVCAYLSAALLLGLGLHRLFGWWWADPAGALIMVPFIAWQGRRAIREANEEGD